MRSPIAAPSAQVRLRYRNARTLLGALAGWREAPAEDDGGPVALLLDRLRTVGHLPALPGLGGAGAARHRDREPAHRRDRAPPAPRHGAHVRAAAHAQLGAGPGHADPRQRTGADLAPHRRADRRRRRARGGEQPARLARAARRRRARARCARRSIACASPATRRRRCARRATTAGGLPDRGAAEPRPADAALSLRRRSRADPPADAAVGGARSDGETPRRAARARRRGGGVSRCSASTSSRSAPRRPATGDWATRSCT